MHTISKVAKHRFSMETKLEKVCRGHVDLPRMPVVTAPAAQVPQSSSLSTATASFELRQANQTPQTFCFIREGTFKKGTSS